MTETAAIGPPHSFTVDEVSGQVNRFVALDVRAMPKFSSTRRNLSGKCSRCGKESWPYSLCRHHREVGAIGRILAGMERDGKVERIKENGRLKWRLKKKVPIVRATPKVGRNEPCACGSGKKYKRCCGS